MDGARRATLSLASFILICFFLPWVQLSCGALKDSASGYDLARDGDRLLWLIPALMVAILIFGSTKQIREKLPALFALAGTVGGSISAYLMDRARRNLSGSERLVTSGWTAIFWLALIASLSLVAAAFVFYARRSRSP